MTTQKAKDEKKRNLLSQRQFSIVEKGDWLLQSPVWIPSEEDDRLFEKGQNPETIEWAGGVG